MYWLHSNLDGYEALQFANALNGYETLPLPISKLADGLAIIITLATLKQWHLQLLCFIKFNVWYNG